RSEKVAFARSHRGQTLGLGAVVLLFNFVPVVGPILMTAAVAGSVLLYHDLEPGRPGEPSRGGISWSRTRSALRARSSGAARLAAPPSLPRQRIGAERCAGAAR